MVDDNAANLKHNSAHLIQLGYHNISTFSNGQQCTGKLADHPDVIFLSYGNSAQTALQVLHQIKNFDPAIPVILLPVSNRQNTFNSDTKHHAENALHTSAVTEYIDHILTGFNHTIN